MSLHPLVICSQLSPSFPCLLHDIPTSNCLWSAVETGLLYLLCLSVVIVIWILRFLLLFQSQFDTKEAYHKAVGYNEEDGGIESEESYISRVESYMRLYGALVQVSPLISSVSMLILHVVIHFCQSFCTHFSLIYDRKFVFVQTEITGVQNTHGVREGWAWLARFLNALPANLYTAVALLAFLEVS